MIIRNVKNPYINNISNQQLQKVVSNKNIITNNKNLSSEEIMKQKIRNMNTQLTLSQNSEQQIEIGMSTLQEKEVGLDNIKDIGNQLKELSKQYASSDLSENDKSKIEKQAEELLNNLGSLMNQKEENNVLGDKTITLTGSDGKTSVILSKSLNITLDFGKLDDTKPNNTDKTNNDKHLSNNVSVSTLLKNPSIIEERILNPVQKSIEKVDDAKSIAYNNFIKEYSSAKSSIDGLFKIGGINAYTKDSKMLQQESIYIRMSALYAHPLNK
ncbi:hypothetical protein [Clostridium estertheticum]|uniref:Flagellin N-terminal domain-containing protein n=1 Tax=Clostridium estertheticum TaxID=238834 RepID=A0A7Y3SU75_9CLOT|nr:hypothetical protein [Clostridium estertheticum]NNU75257.1 hypothetical protein [Clostridium estertheticum]WBL48273.1 hypothetical protein LOR37_06335 [Clostridium estertheticum]